MRSTLKRFGRPLVPLVAAVALVLRRMKAYGIEEPG